MTNFEKQNEIVKRSLVQFVSAHIPGADFSVVDEIVLSYVTSILEEASQDPCFDIEGFIEMMSAYFVEFSTIEQNVVCNWIYKLTEELGEAEAQAEKRQHNQQAGNLSLTSLSLLDIIPESKLRARKVASFDRDDYSYNVNVGSGNTQKRAQHLSETSDCGSTDSSICDYYLEETEALQEMFPDTSYVEVKHCIAIAKGDIDSATQILLHRQETGQALSNKTNLNARKSVVIDDDELKNRIIARYSYVDKNAPQKEFKPMTPKVEPKKLVRYRDNKIVSLKGERFTEVKRDAEDAELKKPKKPIQP